MFKFFLQILCRHDLAFSHNLFGDQIIEAGWKRSLWRCAKCGAIKHKDELHTALKK